MHETALNLLRQLDRADLAVFLTAVNGAKNALKRSASLRLQSFFFFPAMSPALPMHQTATALAFFPANITSAWRKSPAANAPVENTMRFI